MPARTLLSLRPPTRSSGCGASAASLPKRSTTAAVDGPVAHLSFPRRTWTRSGQRSIRAGVLVANEFNDAMHALLGRTIVKTRFETDGNFGCTGVLLFLDDGEVVRF